MLSRLLHAIRSMRLPHGWVVRLVFWGGAIGIGVSGVVFAKGADWAFAFFRQREADWPIWPLVAPPVGLALLAWLTRRYFPGSEGSGIPQAIAALSLRDQRSRDRLLSLRIAVGKLALTVAGLAVGGSVGREGPTVQIGASIMHALGRRVRFPPVDLDRGLILAGGAAGIAAAFNTPLAGIVFAVEELHRSFEEKTSGTIFMAVVMAGVTSLALVGNYTYFGVSTAHLEHWQDWRDVAFAGVFGGLAGGAFARSMLWLRFHMPVRITRFRAESPVTFAFLCGVCVALVGWMSHGITFGTGYAEARVLVQQDGNIPLWFAPAKFVATLASYASGIPAGIFAPSLAIGAGVGHALALISPANPAALVVLAMAGYFAGVAQAPLTALVIVSEMIGSREMTLPLLLASMLGRSASALVCRQSLYRTLSAAFLPKVTPPQSATTPS
jgi:H+/Cl- antiporter ClcA